MWILHFVQDDREINIVILSKAKNLVNINYEKITSSTCSPSAF